MGISCRGKLRFEEKSEKKRRGEEGNIEAERGRERYIYTLFIAVITGAMSNGTGKVLFIFRFYFNCCWVVVSF